MNPPSRRPPRASFASFRVAPLAAWVAWVALVAVCLVPRAAAAHPTRTSAILLDLAEGSVEAEAQLPLDQLGLALERPLAEGASSLLAERGAELGAYLLAHTAATTPDGRPFTIALRSLAVEPVDGADALVARLSLRPPAGAPAHAFTLRYDAILHRVVTHKIFVSVRRDFKTAVFSEKPEPAGVLRYQHSELAVDRSRGSWWQGFRALFLLGTRHIAEGSDHLLFLLVLLLPAPLLARRGRWGSAAPLRRSVGAVLAIVTAFTVGHSLTLVAAATGALRVPSAPVEALIAASILVSAVHALRPVFRGREALIAGGFGLVHGLAFASVLADFGFDSWALALSVLGFNLGIEAMQLAVVALLMPWLAILSRTAAYPAIRVAGAGFGAVAAGGWLVERTLGWPNPIGPAVEFAFARGPYLIGLVALAALCAVRRPLLAAWPSPRPRRASA
jgi:hypothetical protein